MKRLTTRRSLSLAVTAALAAILVALLLPESTPAPPVPANARPFVWDQDERFEMLEARFVEARQAGCSAVQGTLGRHLAALGDDVSWLEREAISPDDARFGSLEARLFDTAALISACPDELSTLVDLVSRLRAALKIQSRSWDMAAEASRNRLYRLLYGSRSALEELLLQANGMDFPTLFRGTAEPSQAPGADFGDIRLHSGDILVSRGGAPTSALIARGNDYPGNFSHIALIHVSEQGVVRVIEAHIEVGVLVSPLETYLADKKLRIMLLRLDHTLAAMRADPLLPHRAASAALAEARSRHIPYDFAMHYDDAAEQFCSEVASYPYAALGVDLWEGLTSMSSRGVTSWLSRLGVERFETHGPSDLEYDPKVVVVAEWRDPATLFDDHVDNAVIDALLEGAERGDELGFDYRLLPLARLAKAYSVLLNLSGAAGPIPEGMTATRALRAQWLEHRHRAVKDGLLARAAAFREEQGYTPPYWELVAMARDALANNRP